MDYDQDKVDEVILALLGQNAVDEEPWGASAWKSYDWDAMSRLYAKGYIFDPKSKAKSVVLTADGLNRARKLFDNYFGKSK